ncbi:helix-turn-helix domain-containing protein [Tsukamurella serpentis]
MIESEHPLVGAVAELVERVGGQIVPIDRIADGDVPLVWDGGAVAAVRLPASASPAGDLGALLASLAAEFGAPLDGLDRAGKQRAVRILEERGAFTYRKSAETVAEVLGVTRFTVYNYLNRIRG